MLERERIEACQTDAPSDGVEILSRIGIARNTPRVTRILPCKDVQDKPAIRAVPLWLSRRAIIAVIALVDDEAFSFLLAKSR